MAKRTGLLYFGDAELKGNLTVKTRKPLDSRTVVETPEDLMNIPEPERDYVYKGMSVTCLKDNSIYIYKGLPEDSDESYVYHPGTLAVWQKISGGGSSDESPAEIFGKFLPEARNTVGVGHLVANSITAGELSKMSMGQILAAILFTDTFPEPKHIFKFATTKKTYEVGTSVPSNIDKVIFQPSALCVQEPSSFIIRKSDVAENGSTSYITDGIFGGPGLITYRASAEVAEVEVTRRSSLTGRENKYTIPTQTMTITKDVYTVLPVFNTVPDAAAANSALEFTSETEFSQKSSATFKVNKKVQRQKTYNKIILPTYDGTPQNNVKQIILTPSRISYIFIWSAALDRYVSEPINEFDIQYEYDIREVRYNVGSETYTYYMYTYNGYRGEVNLKIVLQ